MTKIAVALKNVSLSLPSRAGIVEILKNVDLVVNEGEALGITGPSGSGKTTLLMAIAGLERVSSGDVTVASQAIDGKGEDQLARFRRDNIGIVFQSFHLIPTMTAEENVAVALVVWGVAETSATAWPRIV